MKFLLPLYIPIRWLEKERNRATLYRLAVIVGPLLIAAGFVTDGQVSEVLKVLGVLAGVGGNGLAVRHTTRARRTQRGAGELGVIAAVATIVLAVVVTFWWFGVRPH